MNSLKVPLIIFAAVLLLLVGGVLLLGNPEGTTSSNSLEVVKGILETLEIDENELNACVESAEETERINRDLASGSQVGITGTPAIILLDKETGLTILARGAYPAEPLSEAIKALLAGELSEGDIAYENSDVGITLEVGKLENMAVVKDDHMRGNPDARIALIEYSDLECSFCASFHGIALQLLQSHPEDLVWVYRHFPLSSIHPTAAKKALIAECAENFKGPDAFWAVVDTYFINILSQQQ